MASQYDFNILQMHILLLLVIVKVICLFIILVAPKKWKMIEKLRKSK